MFPRVINPVLRWHRGPLVFALAAIIGSLSLIEAMPARADVKASVTAANGTVGVSQSVSATFTSTEIGMSGGSITFYANGTSIGRSSVDTTGSVNPVSWTPNAAGQVSLTANYVPASGDSVVVAPLIVSIAAVATSTNTVSPGTAKVNSTITITATVSSSAQYQPKGSVLFTYVDGTPIATVGLSAQGKAVLAYQTPATPQTLTFVAVYAGESNALGSSSSPDAVSVTASGSTVSLTVPQTNYVSVPSNLIAKVTPSSAGGSVTFSVGNVVIGSQRVDKGQASVSWTPQAAGTVTVTAAYSGDRSTPRGSASNTVVVAAQTRADAITVDPVGAAGAWVPGAAVSFMNGTSMTLVATAASGMPVQLAASGPCVLAGTRVSARSGTGSCTVTALTKAGNGFSGTSNSYTILLTPGWQTAKLAAPATGTINRGAKVKIGKANLRTTAGQLVSWKITKKAKRACFITYGPKGAAFLKTQKRGICNIRATAPGVDGQWQRYAVYRQYVIR